MQQIVQVFLAITLRIWLVYHLAKIEEKYFMLVGVVVPGDVHNITI